MLILAYIILALTRVIHPAPADRVRATVADGSVWAEVERDGAVRFTERLCDVDARTRWLAADVDGDGRADLVAVHVDPWGAHVDVWRQSADGFAATKVALLPIDR